MGMFDFANWTKAKFLAAISRDECRGKHGKQAVGAKPAVEGRKKAKLDANKPAEASPSPQA